MWNPDHLPISSRRVDVSYDLIPGSTDQYTATVRANDPTLRATYKIEFLESKWDFSPWCSMEGTLGAGGMDTKTQDLILFKDYLPIYISNNCLAIGPANFFHRFRTLLPGP